MKHPMSTLSVIYAILSLSIFLKSEIKNGSDAIEFSNFKAEFKVDSIFLDDYCQGYLLFEGELISFDKDAQGLYSVGDRVQVICDNHWFENGVSSDIVLKLDLCNYNFFHYYKTSDGARIEILSHFGSKDRCYIYQYNGCEKREIGEICPEAGIPLLLCAEVL